MDSPSRRAPQHLRDEVWSALMLRQTSHFAERVARPFHEGWTRIRLDPRRAPRLSALSKRLHQLAGWKLEVVPGLIPVRDFFDLLRDRRFPAPEWIRHPDDLEYTPEPDVFHDVFGHVPQLCSEPLSTLIESLAECARGATDEQLRELERLYWFSIEFGLVTEQEGLRAFGAGLASSIRELEAALENPRIRRPAFDVRRVKRMLFDPHHPQRTFFVVRSLEELGEEIAPPRSAETKPTTR